MRVYFVCSELDYQRDNTLNFSRQRWDEIKNTKLCFSYLNRKPWSRFYEIVLSFSMQWFIYHRDLCHERVKGSEKTYLLPL